MAAAGYNINYPKEIIVKIISKMVQKLEGHQEYVNKISADPTSNHIYFKRGDEINKAIVEFVKENPELPFRYKIVSSGRSPYKHVKLFDYDKNNLIIFKKVNSVESIPKKMFNRNDEDEVSQYLLEYANVNKKYENQMELIIEDNVLKVKDFDEYLSEVEYSTLAIVTYELRENDELNRIAIGIPNHSMDAWIVQLPWSQFIPVSYTKPASSVQPNSQESPKLNVTLKVANKNNVSNK